MVLLSQERIMKILFIAGAIITIPPDLGFFHLADSYSLDSRNLIGTWKGSSSIQSHEVTMIFKLSGGYEQSLHYSSRTMSADKKKTCVWSGFGNYRVGRNDIIIQISHSSDNVRLRQSFRLLKYSQSEMILPDAASGKKSFMRRQR